MKGASDLALNNIGCIAMRGVIAFFGAWMFFNNRKLERAIVTLFLLYNESDNTIAARAAYYYSFFNCI
jgi:hypothetical protein